MTVTPTLVWSTPDTLADELAAAEHARIAALVRASAPTEGWTPEEQVALVQAVETSLAEGREECAVTTALACLANVLTRNVLALPPEGLAEHLITGARAWDGLMDALTERRAGVTA